MAVDVVTHDLFEETVELAVVREHDVTTEVPREALRVDDRAGESRRAV
jgi:hypothetical protein